jgi:protein-tyrosine-phosphatase
VNVLVLCVANSGRSVIGEHLFRRAAGGRHAARSAGSKPAAAPLPQVVAALLEIGVDARAHVPRRVDEDLLAWADVAVTTCAEEVCPVAPAVRRIGWVLDDPRDLPLESVRELRDDIDRRVHELVAALDRETAAPT